MIKQTSKVFCQQKNGDSELIQINRCIDILKWCPCEVVSVGFGTTGRRTMGRRSSTAALTVHGLQRRHRPVFSRPDHRSVSHTHIHSVQPQSRTPFNSVCLWSSYCGLEFMVWRVADLNFWRFLWCSPVSNVDSWLFSLVDKMVGYKSLV